MVADGIRQRTHIPPAWGAVPGTQSMFIQAGANVHSTDDEGTPLLMLAMKKGHSVIADRLVRAGADVDGPDRLGITPLLLACGRSSPGFRSLAEQLIRRGAAIDRRGPLGYTPLLLAISGGCSKWRSCWWSAAPDSMCAHATATPRSRSRVACMTNS